MRQPAPRRLGSHKSNGRKLTGWYPERQRAPRSPERQLIPYRLGLVCSFHDPIWRSIEAAAVRCITSPLALSAFKASKISLPVKSPLSPQQGHAPFLDELSRIGHHSLLIRTTLSTRPLRYSGKAPSAIVGNSWGGSFRPRAA